MLAIDTNLIVRYLTGDDPEHSARAKALIEHAALCQSSNGRKPLSGDAAARPASDPSG